MLSMKEKVLYISDKNAEFSVRYIGCRETPLCKGGVELSHVIRQLWENAPNERKLQQGTLKVDHKGIYFTFKKKKLDAGLQHPIATVTFYCIEGKVNPRLFAWIQHSSETNKFMCYVILLSRPDKGPLVSMALSKAFEKNYQLWKNKRIFKRNMGVNNEDTLTGKNELTPGSSGSSWQNVWPTSPISPIQTDEASLTVSAECNTSTTWAENSCSSQNTCNNMDNANYSKKSVQCNTETLEVVVTSLGSDDTNCLTMKTVEDNSIDYICASNCEIAPVQSNLVECSSYTQRKISPQAYQLDSSDYDNLVEKDFVLLNVDNVGEQTNSYFNNKKSMNINSTEFNHITTDLICDV